MKLSSVFLVTLCVSDVLLAQPVPFGESPHDYWKRKPEDAVTQVVEKLREGKLDLNLTDEKGFLLALLKELNIPVSSQLLVYSATSLQGGLIKATNPRALYFNEETYIGYVPGGRLELSSIDPEMGPVFQILSRTQGGPPRVERTDRCMNCHAGNAMRRLPGFFTESVIPSAAGGSLDGFRRNLVGHTVPLEERFGGWHVTGPHEKQFPLANLLGRSDGSKIVHIKNPPGSQFDWSPYPVQTSDLLAHLVHEHQLEFHNLVTLAVYRAREKVDTGEINGIARDMVRYLLFANEAKLPSGGVKPDGTFMQDFLSAKKAAPDGTSLRDFDLRSRLFKHRCSYMIYTPGFQALPSVIKDRVYAGLRSALSDRGLPEFNYISPVERKQIRTILKATLPGLPTDF
ncbi:MAG: hypothetical protein JNJ83_02145 [Verrucomicrobiaceae bacterium]|nr:hypothetical protein [Verrucomicrobiaceae bacterium]